MINKYLILLNVVRRGARNDFKNLKDLAGFVEHALKRELAHRSRTVEKAIARAPDEMEQGFIAGCYSDDIIQVEREFPRIQRYALFTTAICLTESYVTELCRTAQKTGLSTQGFSNREPSVVARGIDYLQKHAGIDRARHRYYIDLAASLNSLRNCIVHDDGDVSRRRDAAAIRAFVSRIPTLSIDSRNKLELKPGFIEGMSHEMHMLIDLILDAMRKRKEAPTTGSNVP